MNACLQAEYIHMRLSYRGAQTMRNSRQWLTLVVCAYLALGSFELNHELLLLQVRGLGPLQTLRFESQQLEMRKKNGVGDRTEKLI